MLTKIAFWCIGADRSYLKQHGVIDNPTKFNRTIAAGVFLFILVVESLFFFRNMSSFFETHVARMAAIAWFCVWFTLDRAILTAMDRSEAKGESGWTMVLIRTIIIVITSFLNSNAVMSWIYDANLRKYYISSAEEELRNLRVPLDTAEVHYNTEKIVTDYSYNVMELEKQAIRLRDKTAHEIAGDTAMGSTGQPGDMGVAKGVDKQREAAEVAAKAARDSANAALARNPKAQKYFELKKRYAEAEAKMKGMKPGYMDMAKGLSVIRSENPITFWALEFLFFCAALLPFIVHHFLTKHDSYIVALAADLAYSTKEALRHISDRASAIGTDVANEVRRFQTLSASINDPKTLLEEKVRHYKNLSDITGQKRSLPWRDWFKLKLNW